MDRKSTAFMKSSYSDHQCVSVAREGVVGVIDTKDQTGPVVEIAPAAWRAFLTGVTGERQS
ncbi:DUF397 domain-containing protein [Streptomyces johnsoniae]|uniref:DUF397 domain-containing protein n=1 Tax=Streptomyces johnsoniae TaxID=3075532 RepID=A0ABU2RZV5_9ACTN|nr:DUF397 domain-containing protein [Streptomyces sp. DSM 41886]MDT0442292.1 DUF397 domain-containing protein [Streptomyces sp. DSM 41886]